MSTQKQNRITYDFEHGLTILLTYSSIMMLGNVKKSAVCVIL